MILEGSKVSEGTCFKVPLKEGQKVPVMQLNIVPGQPPAVVVENPVLTSAAQGIQVPLTSGTWPIAGTNMEI
ncbi:MAG: hypothetical protein OIF58_08045, partial [Cohaesibacter sp.]|nr:hypothetical protein [Cohaesibacter sp.]